MEERENEREVVSLEELEDGGWGWTRRAAGRKSEILRSRLRRLRACRKPHLSRGHYFSGSTRQNPESARSSCTLLHAWLARFLPPPTLRAPRLLRCSDVWAGQGVRLRGMRW